VKDQIAQDRNKYLGQALIVRGMSTHGPYSHEPSQVPVGREVMDVELCMSILLMQLYFWLEHDQTNLEKRGTQGKR
jgi:hypothetical protein